MPETPQTSSEIEVGALLSKVDAGARDLLLLDVRNQDEFDTWRIEGRMPVETIHIPYFDFIEEAEACAAKVPKGRDLVVLCAKGGSSEMVVDMLKDIGLPAKNVKGGMIAYGDYLEPVRVPLSGGADASFELWQVNRRGKGCLSYAIVSGGEAVVVDPSRHVSWYEEFVASRGAKVSRVLDTHVHADHVSGGPELAERAGAAYFVAAGEGFDLKRDVQPLADGGEISIGHGVPIRVIATPGHTPGSTSYLVGGKALLSGDTLFVSSVGRPDLGGHVEEWGEDLYQTLHERLADLADDVVVLPAHFGGPPEIGARGIVSGRLGDLRRCVPEMTLSGASAFVAAMRAAVKTPPEAYAHIIQTNLGVEHAEADKILEWELGKNQCAVHPAAAPA